MAKTATERSNSRDQRNRDAGLVRVANHWIHGDHKQDALALIKKELGRPKYHKPKDS